MRNQRSPLSLQDRYDNLQIYCQEMREHVQDLEYELSQVHNELRYLHGFISYKKLYDEYKRAWNMRVKKVGYADNEEQSVLSI